MASWLVCIRPCLQSLSLVELKLVPALLLRVSTGVKGKATGFLLRAGAAELMDRFSAGLLPSIWQKRLVIKVDPPIYLSALTKIALSPRS